MMNGKPHTSYKLLPVLLPILFTLIFGSYIFTWKAGLAAAEGDKDVKLEVQQQAKEIKEDLNARLDRLEQRTLDALAAIQRAIENSNAPSPPHQ